MARVDRLAGRTLGEVATVLGERLPLDLSRHKGRVGVLAETVLGAHATSRPVPDFEHLGIELKTLPVDATGSARESTFVCTAPMDHALAGRWEASRVHHKLAAVLWLPVVGDGPLAERVFGQGFVWRPDPDEEQLLREDWEELSGLLALGAHWEVDARRGRVLQLRPKGAHGASLRWTLGEEGDWVQAQPRGFYLRAAFTTSLVRSRLRV